MAEVIVVGGGAAGVIAAWRAATLGANVTLVEKTNRVGTKILVSGGGKCNITQDGGIEEVLRAFRPNEARFIRPACYRFTNNQIVEMLTSKGLRVYTRPDGRIFPVDQTAKDVVAILRSYLEEVGVRIMPESPCSGLVLGRDGEEGKVGEGGGIVKGILYRKAVLKKATPQTEGGYRPKTAKNLLRELDPIAAAAEGEERELLADGVILCTGGSSYPNSGTTGDGWRWLRDLGHTVTKIRAALAPIYLQDVDPERAGVSLRNVVLKARQGKEVARWRGDLLFTHQGISGPTALGISRIVAERLEEGEVSVEVDLLPDESQEALAARVLEYTTKNPTKRVASFVEEIPDRLTTDLLKAAEVPEEMIGAKLDKKSRNRLVNALKGWSLGPVRHVPLEKGEVVAGGVSLDEVDPHTMASKKVRGLYLCGEVLDVAGPVGGYNLQAAFATGYVAGESAAGGPKLT
jgi:predicted flavoprotein YhiN